MSEEFRRILRIKPTKVIKLPPVRGGSPFTRYRGTLRGHAFTETSRGRLSSLSQPGFVLEHDDAA